MPQVQVLSPRPETKTHLLTGLCFLFIQQNSICGILQFPKQLWEQVTEPSAAGGGFSEAEEKKNKENCDALQASKATIFFLVVRRFKSCRLDQYSLRLIQNESTLIFCAFSPAISAFVCIIRCKNRALY